MTNLTQRIKRLERLQSTVYGDVLEAIKAGLYYDEIPPELQEQYAEYRYSVDKENFEACLLLFKREDETEAEALHFPLERKPKPPTPEELEARRKEIETAMDEIQREYNSPEEIAKREAWYQEVQRIGELRRNAFLNGESMEAYPLPWEK